MGYPTIPRKLHFIWVGGPLPARNQDCLKTFSVNASGYERNLWIDTENLLAGTRRGALIDMFKNDKGKLTGSWTDGPSLGHGDRWAIKNQVGGTVEGLANKRHEARQQIEAFARNNRFRVRYIRQEFGNAGTTAVQFMMSQYNREMTERATNFGAASDILRILILLKEGGIYLDTDVELLETMPYINCPHDGALWGLVTPVPPTRTQWFSKPWWREKYGQGQNVSICNSTIAYHANSAAVAAYRDIVQRNYQNIFTNDAAMEKYYDMAQIRSQTIRVTGPTAALEASGLRQTTENLQAQAYGDSQLLGRNLFEKTKHYKRRKVAKYFDLLTSYVYELKDSCIFPAYLLRDRFFHQWL